MISIVCWLWNGPDPRRQFLPSHVNVLQRMIARTLSIPHRFICMTDEVGPFSESVEVYPLPAEVQDVSKIASPEGQRFPSCYRRLWNFSTDAARLFGERILAIDIDLVVVKDLAPILARHEDFVGVRPKMNWGNTQRVAGGMYLLRTGSHAPVWNTFRKQPQAAIAAARAAGYRGSDQAWLSHCLGQSSPVWNGDAGLYSIRDLRDGKLPLPADARLVQFNGPRKPWQSDLYWVKDHWQ